MLKESEFHKVLWPLLNRLSVSKHYIHTLPQPLFTPMEYYSEEFQHQLLVHLLFCIFIAQVSTLTVVTVPLPHPPKSRNMGQPEAVFDADRHV